MILFIDDERVRPVLLDERHKCYEIPHYRRL